MSYKNVEFSVFVNASCLVLLVVMSCVDHIIAKKKDEKGASFSVKLVSVNKLWYPEIHIQYWNKIYWKVKTANRDWGASKKNYKTKQK